MILEISSNRRAEIKSKVIETLKQYATPVLPVKIGSLIKQIPYIKLITYSSQINKYHISYNELIINAETKDSYAVYQKSTGRFCIYYNDIDVYIISSNRVRWNLAHELGHVILNHHITAGVETLYRTGIDDASYNYFEKEADYFAQLILVPHVVLYAFKVKSATQIKHLCKISGPASERRFREYSKWQIDIDGNDPYDKPLFKFYYTYLFKKKCKNCDAKLIQRYGKYCPICGHKTLEWGEGTMIYKKLDTYENGKLKECPTCKNEETNIDGSFCQICGEKLINHCSNYNCENDTPLPSNARYCPICGSPSTFCNEGILKDWNYKEPNSFMFIPDSDEELPFN